MLVTVKFTIQKEEIEDYRTCWKDCNDGDITDKKILERYEEMFWADKQDYLECADYIWEIV